jgi:hypothetical protein
MSEQTGNNTGLKIPLTVRGRWLRNFIFGVSTTAMTIFGLTSLDDKLIFLAGLLIGFGILYLSYLGHKKHIVIDEKGFTYPGVRAKKYFSIQWSEITRIYVERDNSSRYVTLNLIILFTRQGRAKKLTIDASEYNINAGVLLDFCTDEWRKHCPADKSSSSVITNNSLENDNNVGKQHETMEQPNIQPKVEKLAPALPLFIAEDWKQQSILVGFIPFGLAVLVYVLNLFIWKTDIRIIIVALVLYGLASLVKEFFIGRHRGFHLDDEGIAYHTSAKKMIGPIKWTDISNISLRNIEKKGVFFRQSDNISKCLTIEVIDSAGHSSKFFDVVAINQRSLTGNLLQREIKGIDLENVVMMVSVESFKDKPEELLEICRAEWEHSKKI